MDLEPPRNAMHTKVQLLRLTRFKHAPDIHLDSRLRGHSGSGNQRRCRLHRS